MKHEIARIERHRLDYYNSHLDLVVGYIDEKPDISIETCKALIEGISKLTLHLLAHESLEALNQEDVGPLFKRSLAELQRGRGFSDVDLSRRLSSVVHYIGEIRNEHSDIAHGRASLKDQVNDADFADLIIGVTDNLCTYMLRRLDQLVEPDLEYEDNPGFNAYLNELYPLDHRILYSRALFDQEPETYEIELGDYNIENSLEEE